MSIAQNYAQMEVSAPTKSNGTGNGAKSKTPSGTTPVLQLVNRTDMGNATRLIRRFGGIIRYCHPWQKWLVYKDGLWQIDESGLIIRLAEDTVRSMYAEAGATEDEAERKALARWAISSETEARVRGMLYFAKARKSIPIKPEELDRDPLLLNTQNGTVDLTIGKLRPFKKDDFQTLQAVVKYDKTATCPTWLAFLDKIMQGNTGMIRFLQKAVGYSLTGSTREQVLFMLYGTGANGKSTFIAVLQKLLSDYACSTPTSTLTAKVGGDSIPNDVARLKGVRFVSAVETDDGKRLAESTIKQLTGDKTIAARFMRGEWFDFQPVMKLWLATNHKMQVRGTDNGIWRRIRLIPFTVSIPEEEQDKDLYDKLLSELPGILNWAIEGCLLWQQEGLGMPPEVQAATEDYRAEMDTLSDFLSECCITEKGRTASAKELYSRYTKWCEENGERAESQKKFGTRLSERGFTRVKNSTIIWIGIAVTDEREEREDQDQKSGSLIEKNGEEKQTGKSVSIVPNGSILPLQKQEQEQEKKEGEPARRKPDIRLYGASLRPCFKCQQENWYYNERVEKYQCAICQPPDAPPH